LYKIKTLRFSFQPIKSEQAYEGDDKWKVVSYEKTPIMSTYLLAYIVGEFDYVEGKDADGIIIRVYTPVGKKEQGKFALDVSSLFICISYMCTCHIFFWIWSDFYVEEIFCLLSQ
jgi:hypothetical protein